MKKIIFVFAILCAFALQSFGQDRTYQFTYPNMYYSLPYKASDSVSSNSNDSTWYFQWVLSQFPWPNKTDVKVTFDELSGTASAAISLQGKKFSGDAWTNITTVNYSGAGSDTTFTISDGTARLYRYYRLYVDKVYGTAGRGEIDLLEVKIWQTQ